MLIFVFNKTKNMQKLVTIDGTSLREIDELNDNELSNGWNIKQIVKLKDDDLIIVLEKETRKDKLNKLDEISSS